MSMILRSAVLAAIFGFSGGAIAAPTYCSTGSPHPDGIAVTNMTFDGDGPDSTGTAADDCFGVVTKDDASGGNDNNYDMNSIWGTGWTLLAKDDPPGGSAATGTYAGFSFSLVAAAGTGGNWTLVASDLNGPVTNPNFPIYLDLIGVLKASDNFAAYLFDDATIDASGGGTWKIGYENCDTKNDGAVRCNPTPALSHLSLYVRTGTKPSEDPNNNPEPGVLALLAIGLVGVAAIRRRRT